jgi:hypothetical protein
MSFRGSKRDYMCEPAEYLVDFDYRSMHLSSSPFPVFPCYIHLQVNCILAALSESETSFSKSRSSTCITTFAPQHHILVFLSSMYPFSILTSILTFLPLVFCSPAVADVVRRDDTLVPNKPPPTEPEITCCNNLSQGWKYAPIPGFTRVQKCL